MKRHQTDRSTSSKDRRHGSSSSRSAQSARRDRRDGHPKSSRHQSRGESLSSKEMPSRSRQAIFNSDDEENGTNEVHLYGKVTTVDSTGTLQQRASGIGEIPRPDAPTSDFHSPSHGVSFLSIGTAVTRPPLAPKTNPQMPAPPPAGSMLPHGLTPEMMSLQMASYFGSLPHMGHLFSPAGLNQRFYGQDWSSSSNASSSPTGAATPGNPATALTGFGQIHPGFMAQGNSFTIDALA